MSDEIKDQINFPGHQCSILLVDNGKEVDYWPFNLLPIDYYAGRKRYKFLIKK